MTAGLSESGFVESTLVVEGIVTPEAVVLDLETAGIASRMIAGLIDLGVQAALYLVVWIVAGIALLRGSTNSTIATAAAVIAAVVLMGYPVACEVLMRGRTIGKRSMGLRAVTVEGAPIRFRHAMLRMMGGLVDRYLLPIGVIGSLTVLGTRRSQRIGDLMAGTIVVRDPDQTMLPPAIWFPVPPGWEEYAATIDPTAMTVDQYTAIRSFLMRNRELTVDARFTVAREIAEHAARVLRHPADFRRVDPEAFLLCVIARYQRRAFPAYQPAAWQAR